MKKKIIEFASNAEFVETPKPAKNYIPEWFKKAPRFTNGDTEGKIGFDGSHNRAMKLCIPMVDSFTTGYVVELWQDVQVTLNPDGSPNITWPVAPDVLIARNKAMATTLPTPSGHHDIHFVWVNPFVMKTPPNYSLLLTHPLNRHDLPFITLSGVVDSDSALGEGGVPFYLRADFEGIIPAGTPLFQVIPFKRDNWESKNVPSLLKEAEKMKFLSRRVVYGFYKKFVWKKKSYN